MSLLDTADLLQSVTTAVLVAAFWYSLNVLTYPRLRISDQIFYRTREGGRRVYTIKIRNRSFRDVVDVQVMFVARTWRRHHENDVVSSNTIDEKLNKLIVIRGHINNWVYKLKARDLSRGPYNVKRIATWADLLGHVDSDTKDVMVRVRAMDALSGRVRVYSKVYNASQFVHGRLKADGTTEYVSYGTPAPATDNREG